MAQALVPSTPLVVSPSPSPSEVVTVNKDYFAPLTRPAAKASAKLSSHSSTNNYAEAEVDMEGRARSRSRSRDITLRNRRMSGMTSLEGKPKDVHAKNGQSKPGQLAQANGATVNGHLSPVSAAKNYWRELSRSPSPIGLIPIHREWRTFVHKHEIPRKALHVSIGFLTLSLYANGYSTFGIPPVLMTFLVPIVLTDVLRHKWPSFNRFYIRCLGAFMRETEAHEKFNGVIWYLLGAWTVLRFFPKDIGVVGVLCLSWCDTAASTFGRLYGRYTPRIRKGKSLAGSAAACTVGILTALIFWGCVGPRYEMLEIADNSGENAFAFQGFLTLPARIRDYLGWSVAQATVSGGPAIGIMSVCAGLIASASEAVDLFGWDDNITIPVLCGVGLWGFLKIFGSA